MKLLKAGTRVQVISSGVTAIVRSELTDKRLYAIAEVAIVGGTKKEPRIAVVWPDDKMLWFNPDQLEVIQEGGIRATDTGTQLGPSG
jgi:hypothetical protein